ncbi:MAG: glycosyltransferase family 2 protein [Candidatus Aenigmarchaeota archaeon]|nr:glycosyltransferase family 2 protein [Candidatus Aenigmarchaeota archaeon]
MLTALQLLSALWIIPFLLLEAAGIVGILTGERKKRVSGEPRVSFLVAAWKEGHRIRKCVDSILGQRYPRSKISVLVIGGGDKETVGVCKKLSSEGKITYLEEKKRSGKWFALNRGLRKAGGEYVAFTDADCMLEKDWLAKMLRADADMVIADVYSTSEKSFYGKMYAYVWHLTLRVSEGLNFFLKTGEFMGQGSLVKKKVFNRLRFEESFVEDWRLNYKAKRAGFSSAHSTAKTYEYMPGSFNDFRKAGLRTMKGLITEISQIRDPLSLAIIVMSAAALISVPFHAYLILTGDAFGLLALFLLVIFTAFFSFVSSVRRGNYRFILYAPLVIPIVILFFAYATETAVRLLLKKEISWEIYGKKEK